MQSKKQIVFSNLRPNISVAIKESCTTEDEVVFKIANQVEQINTESVEPGLEIVMNLSTIIDTSVKDAVRLGCNLSFISQGIVIGAFRSGPIQLEADKTIRLLVQEIVGAVFNHNGNIKRAVDGLLDGIAIVSKEHNLNVDEAVIIVNECLAEVLKNYERIDR